VIAQEPEASATPAPSPVVTEAAAPESSETADADTASAAGDNFNDAVKAAMKKAPEGNPDEALNAAMLLAHGKDLEAQGRYFEAWNTYQDLAKQYPKDKRGLKALRGFYAKRLTERAIKLEKSKRYFEAANLYRDIVVSDASQAGAWFGLGTIFYRYHKKKPAIYCFNKVLELKPETKGLRPWLDGYQAGN
jgi:tetratricopeptide (TPR) repeat protein